MKFETKWISKSNTLLWMCACFFCALQWSCDVDTAYQKRLTDVIQEDTIYIALRSSAGWELIVFPEGSGRLSFSSIQGESLTFPKGTYHYKKMIAQVMDGISRQKPTLNNAIGVTFGLPDVDYNQVEYLTNYKLAKSVFDRAYVAVLSSKAPMYNKRRLKKRYRKKPPVL